MRADGRRYAVQFRLQVLARQLTQFPVTGARRPTVPTSNLANITRCIGGCDRRAQKWHWSHQSEENITTIILEAFKNQEPRVRACNFPIMKIVFITHSASTWNLTMLTKHFWEPELGFWTNQKFLL